MSSLESCYPYKQVFPPVELDLFVEAAGRGPKAAAARGVPAAALVARLIEERGGPRPVTDPPRRRQQRSCIRGRWNGPFQ